MTPTEQRLAQASEALDDILTLVTAGVERNPDSALRIVAESVLLRILASPDCVRRPAGNSVHLYAERAWGKYLSGELKAYDTDRPAKDVAAELTAGPAKTPHVVGGGT